MVSVTINGSEYGLVFNWQALSDAEEAIGMDKLKSIATCSPLEVAKAFTIGLRHNHPEMTLETVLKLQFPLVEAMKAVDRALLVAYIGHDEPKPVADSDKKK